MIYDWGDKMSQATWTQFENISKMLLDLKKN